MTYALLKRKFRKLKYLEMYNLDLINYVIASACILYNFIIMEVGNDDYFDDEIEEENEEIDQIENNEIKDLDEIEYFNESGQEKRNMIVQIL